MKTNKHKKWKRVNKKVSKKQIRKNRSKAAKIKAKVEKHRQKHKQKSTEKGFFAILGNYINKRLDIEKDFQGKTYGKKANSKYSSAELIKALVCLIIMGLKRVHHAKDYRHEHIAAKIIGLVNFPSGSTFYRFLKKFGTWTFCKRIQRVNRDQIREQLENAKEIVCDGDTSKIQTYQNKKHGACKGYNKDRPGSPCFQASQYFVNGMSVKPDILPGNKVPLKASRTLNDLKEVRRLCGRLDWIRLDAGFMGQRMLEELDNFSRQGNSQQKVKYAVNVGMQCIGAIEAKRRSGCREWIKLGKGVLLQDHGFCQIYKDDNRLHRLLLIKEFFSGGKGKGQWRYYTICSNQEHIPAITLYYFYHQRQTIENFFSEAKNDYYMEHLPCTKIMSNALFFNILCLAYNLLYLFRHDILRKQDHNIQLSTFQRRYLSLQIPFDGNTLFILRSSSFYYRRLIAILHRLEQFGCFLKYQIC